MNELVMLLETKIRRRRKKPSVPGSIIDYHGREPGERDVRGRFADKPGGTKPDITLPDGRRVQRAQNQPQDVTERATPTRTTRQAGTGGRTASTRRGRPSRVATPPLERLKPVESEYEDWDKYLDKDGREYWVGPGGEYETPGFVGVNTDDEVLATGDTKPAATRNLDRYLKDNVQPTRTRTRRQPTVAAPKKTTKPMAFHERTAEDDAAWKARKLQPIPPQWTDVHIADDLDTASRLAWGRDSKNRVVSIYSTKHREEANKEKYQRQKTVAKALPALDAQLAKDLKSSDPKTRQTAQVVLIMRKTGMRVSSERDRGGEKEAYGASTLQARHVQVTPAGSVIFDFSAKKGVHTHLVVKGDSELAAAMTDAKGSKKNREKLFPSATENSTREYIRNATGIYMKNHDLRTHLACVIAAREIKKRKGKPATLTEYRRWRNEVGDVVAAQLGNNRGEALKSYINPALFDQWALED